ncbi:MAG TPA: hypothetical protein VL966_18995 [Alphaproteobacteria bacterium]|jgi:hypothetical protein|nr:hypothetical protein [Alphaproteobacteria bacterium]
MSPSDIARAAAGSLRLTPAEADEIVRRATEYPYAAPAHSYLYDASSPTGWRALPPESALLQGRTPVLASGSNRAPERLAQKFRALFPAALIPVTRAHLGGFDSVYCAHVTSYGSVPATLHPSPGTRVALHVTWLTDDELACMHETEQPGINYHFARLRNLDLTLDDGRMGFAQAYAYLSVHGAALFDGAPVALAAIEATARRFPARDQNAMLARLHALTASELRFGEFVRGMIGAEIERVRLRESYEALLRRSVARFPFDTVDIVPVP